MANGENKNGLKRYGLIGTVAALAAAAGAGLVSLDLPPWAVEMTKLWGPGFLMVLCVFGGVAYYVPRDTVPRFVQSQQDAAIALSGIKDQMQIMSGQSGQLHEIKETLSEILTHQHVNGERLKTIETAIGHGRADDT